MTDRTGVPSSWPSSASNRCRRTPGAPILWLAGGPGDHGSDDIEGPYLELVRAFQEVADVIALDQRGTGLSRPLLLCPGNEATLPLERPYDADLAMSEYRRLSRACARHFTSQGIDLSAYNTVESVHDIDALRRALGAEKFSLYGASYGTHLALAVLRYHPDSVDRVVLSGVEGPDHSWKLPSNAERFFEIVFELARNDEALSAHYPDLETMVREVIARLEAEPVSVVLQGEEGSPDETIVIGATDLRRGLRAFLGSRPNISQLPMIFAQLYEGDYELTARYLRGLRTVSVWSAMYYCMDCASGATPQRRERIESEAPTSITGVVDFPFPGICEAWPYQPLDESFRGVLHADNPTLFISGTLDGQTPPSNADEVARGFTNATRIVVNGGSHQYLELDPPGIARRMVAFLRGQALADTTFAVPLEFVIPEEKTTNAGG